MWGGGRRKTNFGGRAQSLVGESEKSEGLNGVENVWFLGCCDASDANDGEECTISVMRGSGGNLMVGTPPEEMWVSGEL